MVAEPGFSSRLQSALHFSAFARHISALPAPPQAHYHEKPKYGNSRKLINRFDRTLKRVKFFILKFLLFLKFFADASSVHFDSYCGFNLYAMAAAGGADWRLPSTLPEFTRYVPPGWKPGLPDYSYKQFLERLHLWWRIAPVTEEEAGPLVASRLLDKAFEVAMHLKVTRDGTVHSGDAALALAKREAIVDGAGQLVQEADPAGIGHLIKKLTDSFEIHDQDRQGDILDKFWDTRRGSAGLQDYLLNFKQRYQEAETKAGLTVNMTGLTHLLFKWSGLPARRIADIKLHFGGDLDKFNEIFSMISRIAKQEMASSSGNHYGHYGETDMMELNDEDYQLSYYTDEEPDEGSVYYTYDEDTDLHYRDYMTEQGEWRYGAYDSFWNRYDQDDVEHYLDQLDLDEAYQMSGFRPKWRYNGRRKGKGKGRFRSKGRGKGKGFGKFRKGKGRDAHHVEANYGGKNGKREIRQRQEQGRLQSLRFEVASRTRLPGETERITRSSWRT